jgi:hypothetical protein
MEKQKEKAAQRVERKAERLDGPSASADIETGEVTPPADENIGVSE